MVDNPIINEVRKLKPGQAIQFSMYELKENVPGYHYNGAYFSPADRVLENIIGSAYEFRYQENFNGDVIFYRLDKPLENSRSYTSPDRR